MQSQTFAEVNSLWQWLQLSATVCDLFRGWQEGRKNVDDVLFLFIRLS